MILSWLSDKETKEREQTFLGNCLSAQHWTEQPIMPEWWYVILYRDSCPNNEWLEKQSTHRGKISKEPRQRKSGINAWCTSGYWTHSDEGVLPLHVMLGPTMMERQSWDRAGMRPDEVRMWSMTWHSSSQTKTSNANKLSTPAPSFPYKHQAWEMVVGGNMATILRFLLPSSLLP